MKKVVLVIVFIAVGALLWLGRPVFALPPCNSSVFMEDCGHPYVAQCPTCVSRDCLGFRNFWCDLPPVGRPVYDCHYQNSELTICAEIMYECEILTNQCVGDGVPVGELEEVICDGFTGDECGGGG